LTAHFTHSRLYLQLSIFQCKRISFTDMPLLSGCFHREGEAPSKPTLSRARTEPRAPKTRSAPNPDRLGGHVYQRPSGVAVLGPFLR
jgi:hypothetical protein